MSAADKTEEEVEKKMTLAGHPPAVKVGGMRVGQNKRHSESHSHEKEEKEEPNPNDEHKVVVSGVPADEKKDFPAEAVKAYHDKPLPTNAPSHVPPQRHLNQPRKN